MTPKGNFLIEKNMAPVPLGGGGFGLPGGERFYESAEFYEIESSGRVLYKYGKPESISLGDKLIVSSIHRVVGDTLYHFYWSRVNDHEAEIQADKRVRNLQLYEVSLPFDQDVVIAAYEEFVIQLIEEQTYKPPPSDIVEDVAGHAFRLFELTMTHKHVAIATMYDYYMDEESTYKYPVTDYYRLYLVVPSHWYRDDAFDALIENKVHEAIDKRWLTDEYQQKHESVDFTKPLPSKREAVNIAEVGTVRFYIFREDFTLEEKSLEAYKTFLRGLRARA